MMFFAPLVIATIPSSIAELPWLKFIPLIVAFIITLCEALSRGPRYRWFYKFLLPLLSAIALVASCWIVWVDDKIASESRDKENLHLDRIEGRLGNEEATNRYLTAVGNLTRQLTAAKTGSSAEKFFNSKDERQKLRGEVDQANRKLLLEYEIRMNPVRDYILAKFDAWTSEIQKRGVKVRVSSFELPAVKIGADAAGFVRSVAFESEDTLQVLLGSAVINDGHLTRGLECRLDFHSNRGKGDGQVFLTFIQEDSYQIVPTRPRFTYKPYTGKSENPIEDKEFIASLDTALDEAMEFAVEEGTTSE